MVNDIVLGRAQLSTLTSIRQARADVDRTSERLATGLDVNRPTDQPQNFFTATALRDRATDFNRLLDNISTGTRTIQEAASGLEAIETILNLTELRALEAQEALERTTSALPDAILADAPVGYFRLNDANEPNAVNLGTLGAGGDGVYTNGVTQGDEILFFGAGGLPARFDGNSQYVAVPNDDSINTGGPFPERTVELIFNADNTGGRQVLFEEGGTVNSLNIYIDNGVLRVNGRTTNGPDFGPLDLSVPIEAGVSYHVAFTQDGPGGRFTGYLNGEAFGSAAINSFIGNHPNFNGIGAVNQNIYFHDDGPGNAPARANGSFAFQGQISDVAIYNSIISDDGIAQRYEATSLPLSEQFRLETQAFLEQLDGIVEDSNFRGVNLLDNERLTLDFNEERTSQLRIDGADFSIEGLGLQDINFQRPSQVRDAIASIRNAISQVRDFGTTLANDINIIDTRETFTQNLILTHNAGADDLVVADLNAEGANLLASQARLDLSTTALRLSSQSQESILQIFGSGSALF